MLEKVNRTTFAKLLDKSLLYGNILLFLSEAAPYELGQMDSAI